MHFHSNDVPLYAIYMMHSILLLVLALIWMIFYRDQPQYHPWVSGIELNKLVAGKVQEWKSNSRTPTKTLPTLFRSLSAWSIWLSTFILFLCTAFFVTYTPSLLSAHELFFVDYLGIYSMLPFILLPASCLISAIISHFFAQSTKCVRIFNSIGFAFVAVFILVFPIMAYLGTENAPLYILSLTMMPFGLSMVGGFLRSLTIVGRAYAKEIVSFSAVSFGAAFIIIPIIVTFVVNENKLADWMRIFFFLAFALLIATVEFAVFGRGRSPSWAESSWDPLVASTKMQSLALIDFNHDECGLYELRRNLMLRYQASIYGDSFENSEVDNYHSMAQPSTIASSNGLRGQQGRVIRRQPVTTYKSLTTCRYHTTTASSSKICGDSNSSGPKYVLRMPKTETNKYDENRPNVYVPAFEPLKPQYTTVPACMSMGGEYVYEEEVEVEEDSNESTCGLSLNDRENLSNNEGFNSSPIASDLVVPKDEDDSAYLKSSGPLILSTPTSSSSSTSTPVTLSNTSKLMSMRNRLQPTRFSCPQADCFWRGPTDLALRKHMQMHGKQPLMYQGAKSGGDPMKVQLVQPKPKGVKCSECDTFAYSRPLLLRHMHDAHGIEAPLIRRTFPNREMLQSWLDSLRETHAVEFVVSSGSKKWGRGLQVHYLTCSRSGDQKERPNKKYVRPPRPSIKCGRNCMAYLKIKQNPTVSELQIEGCLHHSGHEIDHTRMILEPNELSSIGCIVEMMNEGSDILRNAELMRSFLGSSGRFRLVTDRGLIDQMPIWVDQKVKREIEDEDALAAENLLKDDIDETKNSDIFENPMIDDNILCDGEDFSGISSVDGLLSANLEEYFAEDFSNFDFNADFLNSMDDADFSKLLDFDTNN
ncbi:unnamed protein product [Caenorhabditis bovis]|uniref:C2H2-type domain-containing protein n=1 Tax=Caenorhabditis bovis TaxID=2654633 RepID=A0A8S1EXG8_9PELO|nr:unnamed protein product [Caenorhabditis bovis]